MIRAIETAYNGYRFRSRAEARWAIFFDFMRIEYQYEVEGLEFPDGTKYLPDFYLPASDSFFEVKGIMSDYDMHKIQSLIASGKSCTIGYPDLSFEACDNWWEGVYGLTDKESSCLVECAKCEKKFFAGCSGSYVCQCCGAYDGDHYFRVIGRGNLIFNDNSVNMAIKKARRARFDKAKEPGE